MKEFSHVLRELRNKEGLSQEALGSIVHVSRSAIAKYENGLGLPSEEVIEALCKYFSVDRDYLFPKEDFEQLIMEKNIIINKQKISKYIITISLLFIILILIIFGFMLRKDIDKSYKLEDLNETIMLEDNNFYQKQQLLFEFYGGYVHQKIEIEKIAFTSESNLYLIRVCNEYTNGYMAHINNQKGFSVDEYTKKVYMGINFPSNNNNIRPITSWHQKHSSSLTFNTQFGLSEDILLDDTKNLLDGARIEKFDDKLKFIYECSITNWLFDYEYNNILRKCIINNNYYNSSWEYEMLNEQSMEQSFSIISSYLIEAKPNQVVKFEIDTIMNTTSTCIEQKKIIDLYI
ncbi:MAG: helix-turn-helix transcriptional regulator [Bacilli bacterium]|nr:helix-turn-helix transcriptional regulator [Bacilli bacterium]